MKKHDMLTAVAGLVLSVCMVLAGCSGKGVGGSGGNGSGTTVVSGKVTLSSSILAGKPSLKEMFSVPPAKPGTKAYREMSQGLPVDGLNKVLFAPGDPAPLSNATVELYDADHPEWLLPISAGNTDSSGDYSLSTMTNASRNEGATYADGDPIPAGKYTLIAFKNGLGQKPVVAVQTIVTEFDGTIPNVNFEVLDSDIAPAVISILGLPKNKDGSQVWGTESTKHPLNSAIQVTFSMPMMRDYLSAIALTSSDGGTIPTGKWSLSADWRTATFYLDEGQVFSIDKTYTITIYGADDAGGHTKVVNVYGNTIDATAICKFTASALDVISPSVQWNSPTVIEMGNLVDVTQSFRIESNESLDVNKLSLRGTPSIGVKPGVLFLGKNNAGLYVYEFDLGAPLQLNTEYSITVSGGKDLAGHVMNLLTGKIRTNTAENTPGIDPAATPETQNLQAAVKAIFGKWVRSLDDRNLAQFQGMMSPEFYLEYDVAQGIDSNSDINRDGRFSFSEFSNMMSRNGFLQWDYCGTRITGIISPVAGTYIKVYPGELPPRADFEFKLNASNTLNSRECSEAAPRESLYATLRYKNGVWKIVRASSGIDTRDKTIQGSELLLTSMYQINNADDSLFSSTSDALSDGYKFDGVPNMPNSPINSENIAIKYSWDPMPGVTTYVLMVMDARKPWIGRAIAFPSSITTVRSDEAWVADIGGTDVSQKFGFGSDNPTGGPGSGSQITYVGGGQYYWEVIGFSTISNADMPSKTRTALLQDIKANSFLRNYSIAGSYDELHIQVKPGTNPNATPITYSEVLNGYDLKNNGWATLTVYSPNKVSGGNMSVYGSQYSQTPITFDASGQSTFTVALYQGWNWVNICDNGDYTAVPPKLQLCKSFSILTTGGIPPIIQVWEVIDDTGATLVGDAAQYFVAEPGATKVTIKGITTDTSVMNLNLNLWNQNGAYSSAQVQTTCGVSTCNFTVTDLEIYQGENWINVYGQGAQSYSANIGIYTDTGAVWVPPISVTDVTESTPRAQYPSSSDWDAAPGTDYTVTINGKFKIPVNGTYNTWAEGGYQNGTLNALSDGSFSLNVLLYNGWNYISLNDSQGAWYGVNIYTDAGKPVIKPVITTIDSSAYNASGSATVSQCVVKIDGTSVLGQVNVNVSGYGLMAAGFGSFYENQTTQSTGAADPGNFTIYVPVASGAGSYTYVDIYDKDYKGISVQLSTTANCTYAAPASTFLGVRDSGGTDFVNDHSRDYPPNEFGLFQAGTNATVTLHGTANRAGHAVTVESNVCGNRITKSTNASLTPSSPGIYDWNVTMEVYGTYNSGTNNFYVSDGSNYRYVYVNSTNTVATPPPPIQATVTPGTWTGGQCTDAQYDSGSVNSVTISGTTTAPDGTGYYRDALNGNHPFAITSGAFTIPNVTLYNGYNNLNVRDTSYNYFYLSVYSATTDTKPQFVKTASPINNATVAGSFTVAGSITDPVGTGYVPSTVYASVYNSASGVSKNYSSDLYQQQQYGYGAISFDPALGTYTFVADLTGQTISPTSYMYVDVYAYDNINGIQHGHTIYLNTGGGWTDYYYKPGAKKVTNDLKKRVIDQQIMNWELWTFYKTQ
jgi:hypothetical protein